MDCHKVHEEVAADCYEFNKRRNKMRMNTESEFLKKVEQHPEENYFTKVY